MDVLFFPVKPKNDVVFCGNELCYNVLLHGNKSRKVGVVKNRVSGDISLHGDVVEKIPEDRQQDLILMAKNQFLADYLKKCGKAFEVDGSEVEAMVVLGRKMFTRYNGRSGCWTGYLEATVEEMHFFKVGFHGGVTFDEDINGTHFVGFDCAHIFDFIPSMALGERKNYKNMQFVKRELFRVVNKLGQQQSASA